MLCVINGSDPGRIVFIKQTSEAQDGAAQNLCMEIINVLAEGQSPKWQQVLEGTEMGKYNTAHIPRHRKLGQHKNNYLA